MKALIPSQQRGKGFKGGVCCGGALRMSRPREQRMPWTQGQRIPWRGEQMLRTTAARDKEMATATRTAATEKITLISVIFPAQ